LLGQFRKGEANDPGTFITSIAAVLARYSEAVVVEVTDPRTGLASQTDWLPTVREVSEACEKLAQRAASASKVEAAIAETLKRRAEEPVRSHRPTLEQLREKYGENFGLNRFKKLVAERSHERDERDQARTNAAILAEYERLGKPPVYAGDLLVSPGLAETIRGQS